MGQIEDIMNKKEQRAEAKRLKALAAAAAALPEDTTTEGDFVPEPTGLVALPKMKRVRKPKAPKDCACGCGAQTKGGRFVPGHDGRLHGWVLRVQRGVVKLTDIPNGERQAVAAHIKASA